MQRVMGSKAAKLLHQSVCLCPWANSNHDHHSKYMKYSSYALVTWQKPNSTSEDHVKDAHGLHGLANKHTGRFPHFLWFGFKNSLTSPILIILPPWRLAGKKCWQHSVNYGGGRVKRGHIREFLKSSHKWWRSLHVCLFTNPQCSCICLALFSLVQSNFCIVNRVHRECFWPFLQW